MADPHADVVATDRWLEETHGLTSLVSRFETAASTVKQAEAQVVQASSELRQLEEQLADREADLAYPHVTNAEIKNAPARDAQVGRDCRADDDWCRLRREVEAKRTELARHKSEHNRCESHQKNLRVKAEVVAARLRAIAR